MQTNHINELIEIIRLNTQFNTHIHIIICILTHIVHMYTFESRMKLNDRRWP